MKPASKNKKVVWVTDASGISGESAAIHFLEKGYTVYAGGNKKEPMTYLRGLGAYILQMDTANDRDRQSGIDEIIANEGRIDILVNSGGLGLSIETEDAEIVKYRIQANVFSMIRVMQLVLPYMKKQKSGKIFNSNPKNENIASKFSGWQDAASQALEIVSAEINEECKTFGVGAILFSSKEIHQICTNDELHPIDKTFMEIKSERALQNNIVAA